MGINLGSSPIADIKMGETQVDKAYLGSELVWQKSSPVPEIKALKFVSEGVQTLGVDNTGLGGVINPVFEYSTDGTNWSSWDITTTLSFGNGTDLYIRGMNTQLSANTTYTQFVFSTNSPVYCSGNVMHLYDYTQDLLTFPNLQFGLKNLFYNATPLVTPPSLPATTLASSAYENMFYNCYNLVKAPALPSLTMTENCYKQMFRNCTSLVEIPALPATTLASNCYRSMFDYCTKIKVSETQSSEYQNEYNVGALITTGYGRNMLNGTGGTLTTYISSMTVYTANTIIS